MGPRANLAHTAGKWGTLLAFALVTSCGGGGGGGGGGGTGPAADALTFSGVAAQGKPIPNAPVDMHCVSGESATTTSASGAFDITIPSGALPCVARVTDADGNALHSITAAEGVFNITPLTELLTASVAQAPTTLFFAGFNAEKAARITETALQQAHASVRSSLSGFAIDPTLDFVKTPFTANGTDPMDAMLDRFRASIDANAFGLLRNRLAGLGGGDTTPPTLVVSVDRQSLTAEGTVKVTAQASDAGSGIGRVQFYRDDTPVETVPTAPFVSTFSFTGASNGNRRIMVKAYDNAGNVTISQVILINVNITINTPVDNVPPTVSLAVPTTTVTSAGDFVLSATATDNVGISRVEFYRGTTNLGPDSTPPYQYTDHLTSADNGSVTYTAVAYDYSGNATSAQAVTVNVDITPPTWTIVDLGALGGSYSTAVDINDAGEIVGTSTLDNDNRSWHAFVYRNGKITDLGAPGTTAGGNSFGAAINNGGDVVGYTDPGNFAVASFIYRRGEPLPQALPLPPTYKVVDINDAGDLVGTILNYDPVTRTTTCITCVFFYRNGALVDLGSFAPNQTPWASVSALDNSGRFTGSSGDRKYERRSYLYSAGTVSDLGELPGTDSPPLPGTEAADMNNAARIVGQSNGRPFVYANGVIGDLAPGIAGGIYPRAINDAGDVVGMLQQTTTSAFLLHNGGMTDLNALAEVKAAGWTITEAVGINNAGQIIGNGINPQGQRHPFLLTPPKG